MLFEMPTKAGLCWNTPFVSRWLDELWFECGRLYHTAGIYEVGVIYGIIVILGFMLLKGVFL